MNDNHSGAKTRKLLIINFIPLSSPSGTRALWNMVQSVCTSLDDSVQEPESIYASAEAHLLKATASELEALRQEDGCDIKYSTPTFPRACLALMYSIPGNDKCVDCGCPDPSWASISYGTLLCLNCSGRHRGLGVKLSKVRSIYMDDWSHESIMCMLEGGNGQLAKFFGRHQLLESSDSDSDGSTFDASKSRTRKKLSELTCMRYKTKAALFYRDNLRDHVARLMAAGPYQGRQISRSPKTRVTHRIQSPK